MKLNPDNIDIVIDTIKETTGAYSLKTQCLNLDYDEEVTIYLDPVVAILHHIAKELFGEETVDIVCFGDHGIAITATVNELYFNTVEQMHALNTLTKTSDCFAIDYLDKVNTLMITFEIQNGCVLCQA